MEAKKKKKIFSRTGAALFILSLGYIGAETLFNMRLLEVAGSVSSSPDEIDHLQKLGRAISACGFFLLVLGLFSGMKFRLQSRRSTGMFAIVALVCLVPPLMMGWRTMFSTGSLLMGPLDLILGFLPFMGAALILISRGRFRFFVILSLLLLAWPAMFLGQNLFIERYLIDRTAWQDRQNARYMLMLRSGMEECRMELEGLQFCDDKQGAPEMKAARIIISALWMLNPEGIMQNLKENREGLIESAALHGTWFSPQKKYAEYVDKAAKVRSEIIEETVGQYYIPYRKASEIYFQATNPVVLQREADAAVVQVEAAVDAGWREYQGAVSDYRQSLNPERLRRETERAAAEAREAAESGWRKYEGAVRTYKQTVASGLGRAIDMAAAADKYCAEHYCPDVDVGSAVDKGKEAAEQAFYDRTGYPPDLKDRADFMAQYVTQQKIRTEIEEKIRSRPGMEGFSLPYGWTYDEGSFRDLLSDVVRQQVGNAEQIFFDSTGYPPDLEDRAEFMAHVTTQQKIREEVEKNIRKKFGAPSFALPAHWTYEENSFKDDLKELTKQHAKDKWEKKFGPRLPPGLESDAFMGLLGVDAPPPVEKLVMSEDDFFKEVVVPANRKIVDGMIADMDRDMRRYAPDATEMDEGKEYARAIYIPPLTLVVSLSVVMLTLLRGMLALAHMFLRSGKMPVITIGQRYALQGGLTGFFAAVLLLLSYSAPNPYARGPAYDRYLDHARERHIVIASVLDWTARAQPPIYRMGRGIARLF